MERGPLHVMDRWVVTPIGGHDSGSGRASPAEGGGGGGPGDLCGDQEESCPQARSRDEHIEKDIRQGRKISQGVNIERRAQGRVLVFRRPVHRFRRRAFCSGQSHRDLCSER